MVELAIRERQRFGLAANQLDARSASAGSAASLRRARASISGALVEPDDAAAVAAHELLGDHAGSGGDIEHALVGRAPRGRPSRSASGDPGRS